MIKRFCRSGWLVCVVGLSLSFTSSNGNDLSEVGGCRYFTNENDGCNQTASVLQCGAVPNGAVAGDPCGQQIHRYTSPSFVGTGPVIGDIFPGFPTSGYSVE